MNLPILYSLRRCPYCVRARLSLLLAQQSVMLRDVVTSNLPAEMLKASPKGTVPVLVMSDSSVIDESLDIMLWALRQNDPLNLLLSDRFDDSQSMMAIIAQNDNEFVPVLDKYKIASRYHHSNEVEYRDKCIQFLRVIEQRLESRTYIMGNKASLADYAVLPFMRQFSRVDRKWFLNAPFPKLQQWLTRLYQDPLYSKAMTQYPRWLDNREDCLFGFSH